MTAAKELHDRIDRLSPEDLREVEALLDAKEQQRQAEVTELARLLDELSEPLPGGQQQALLADLERKPWRGEGQS